MPKSESIQTDPKDRKIYVKILILFYAFFDETL